MSRLLCLATLAGCWSSTAKVPAPPPPPAPITAPVAATSAPDHVCVLASEIIEVDKTSVAVFTTNHILMMREPIRKQEHLPERCGGPGGGHAGCSITYDRYWSDAIPNHVIEFGNNQGNVLIDETDDNNVVECQAAPD